MSWSFISEAQRLIRVDIKGMHSLHLPTSGISLVQKFVSLKCEEIMFIFCQSWVTSP